MERPKVLKKVLSKVLPKDKKQINAQSASWEKLIEQLHKPLASVEKNVEEQLLNLVLQLTEAVVLHEAKTNPDILMAAVATGIKSLPSSEAQTQICLHPNDIKLVEAQFGELTILPSKVGDYYLHLSYHKVVVKLKTALQILTCK